jgi:hypothetical protein
MNRREFITLLGGAVVPLAARGQQGDRVRRIGVLMPGDENNPVAKANVSAFTQALAALGWTDARNVWMDVRWGAGDAQMATLATRHGIAASDPNRSFVEVGGLMSYGTDGAEVWHQIGIYAGRIVNGDKPGDLPVVQSTRFEFIINLQTAKALGIEVPPMLLARADKVVE